MRRGAVAGEVVGALAPPAREPPAAERAPRDHRDAVLLARRQHVVLDAADEHRVRRLLAHEALAVAALRHPLRLDDRGCGKRRAADVAHLALVHQVGQRAERLVDVGVGTRPVHLVEVDVVGVEAAQALLALTQDPASRAAAHVRIGAHVAVHLGGEHDVVAAALDRLGHDLFRLSARVHVGGVDEVDPGIERGVDHVDRLVVVVVAPRAEHHRPEAQGADLHARSSERPQLHRLLLVAALRRKLPRP